MVRRTCLTSTERSGRTRARGTAVGVSVSQAEDVASRYDAYYFRNYRGGSCERNARWLSTFGALADAIVRELNPATVLDAGCAKGLLVESLRDRGVDAHG